MAATRTAERENEKTAWPHRTPKERRLAELCRAARPHATPIARGPDIHEISIDKQTQTLQESFTQFPLLLCDKSVIRQFLRKTIGTLATQATEADVIKYQADVERLCAILKAEIEGHRIDRDEVHHLLQRLTAQCPDIKTSLHMIAQRLTSQTQAAA